MFGASTRERAAAISTVWLWLPVAVASALFALLQYYAWPQVGDDAFIFYRYAERLAGGALTWSDGEAAVEGFSSPLWLGCLSLLALAGGSVVWWAKILGTVCAVTNFIGVLVLARRLGAGPRGAAAAGLVFALMAGPHFWAAAGLETSMYAALFTWCGVALVGSGSGWVLPTMAIGVVRPEGPFVVFVAVGLVILRDRRLPPWRHIGLALLPAAAWEVFRIVTYGAPLPNTYYAKATGGASQWAAGVSYVWPLMVAMALLAGVWATRGGARTKPLLLLAWAGALLAVIVGGGGDWMAFWRLAVPLFGVVIAIGLALWTHGHLARLAVVLTAALLLWTYAVPVSWIAGALRGGQLPVEQWQEGEMAHASKELAGWLRERYPHNTVMAVNHAGALPYFTGFGAIDMTGLNDPHIARVPGALHGKYDSDYVLSLEPDLVVLNSRVRPGTDGRWYHEGYWEGETDLAAHPEFRRCYVPLEEYATWGWSIHSESFILVYERSCPSR